MGCTNYASKHFGMVERKHNLLSLDQFQQWLGSIFTPESQQMILDAIQNGDWNINFSKDVVKKKIVEVPRKEYSDEGFFTLNPSDKSTLSFYSSEDSEGRIAHNKMINSFKTNIIKRLIYDYETRTSPNIHDEINGVSAVNQLLFEYKTELMNTLWKAMGIDYSQDYTDYKQFTEQVAKTLSSFEMMSHSKDLTNVYESYVILKNFDNLLRSHVDIVSINPAFENGRYISRDMYTYKGPSMKRDASIGKESADANDYTGSIVKLLLNDYFPEVKNGKPDPTLRIGLTGFNRVMTSVLEWIEKNNDPKIIKELDKGANCDWFFIMSEYSDDIKANRDTYTSILKPKIDGIIEYIFSQDSNLPYEIKNSFNRHVRDVFNQNYSEYVKKRGENGMTIQTDLVNDSFIEGQLKTVYRVIQSKVDLFRSNPDEFDTFCKRHGITIEDGKIIIDRKGLTTTAEPYVVTVNQMPGNSRYTFTRNKGYLTRNNISVNLISDLFDFVIPSNYEDVLNSINEQSLLSCFYTPIMLTLAASSNQFDDFKYNWEHQLDVHEYKSDMQSSGKFFAQIYGGDTINVVKNREGNNLPLYSIGSITRKIKRIINDVDTGYNNAYSGNRFVQKPNLLGKVITRNQADTSVGVKASKDNSIPEIATIEVLHDFYEKLYSKDGNIWIQPICYADKSTHTMFEVNIDEDTAWVNGENKSISSILIDIASNTDSNHSGEQALINRVFKERKTKLTNQAVNMINKYLQVFKFINPNETLPKFLTYKSNPYDILDTWNKVRETIRSIGDADVLRNMFRIYNENNNNKLNLIEDFDFGKGLDGKLDVNLTFDSDLKMYISPDGKYEFINHIKDSFRLTAKDYWEHDIFIVGKEHEKVKDWLKKESVKDWFDSTNFKLKIFRVWDSETKKYVNVSAKTSDAEYFDNPRYSIELNPIFKSHFYAKLLYAQPLKDLLLGSTYAYNAKVEFKGDVNNAEEVNAFLKNMRASRIIEETKRALYCGATTTTYLQGLSYGVPVTANVACVSDLQGLVFNPKGDRDSLDVHDGSSWVSPYWAIQTNESLGDASVGWNKKTIYGHIDPESGVFTEIKHAEFALSNQYRKCSPLNNEFSAEEMFRKTHNKQIPEFRWKDINLRDFYSRTSSVMSNKRPGKLTHQTPVYYFDPYTAQYYEIISISNVGSEVTIVKSIVSERGVRQDELIKDTKIVQSIYDLDQLFGGAFCKEKDVDSGYLIDSNINNYIVNNIICENDLKDYMVHFVCNKSAIKVGQKNLNDNTIFSSNNFDELQTFTISTKYGGVIMDADHEIEDSEVREMGQLISALMQEGNSAEEAKQIYSEIGQVVYANVEPYIKAFNAPDKTELYNKLGNALLDAFATQNRDVIGLAQAFISKFEQGNQKYQIPFSSATIAPAFMSAVSSLLTKKGIRRTFPGVGAVQVPGRGVMMTYRIGGLNYDFEGAAKLVAKMGLSLEQALSVPNPYYDLYDDTVDYNGYVSNSNNPFIEMIDPEDIDFEDTLIIEGQLVKIKDIKSYDYYRNIYKQPILRHNFQPRDLLAPVPKFNVNGKTYSIYDLDAVRKCNYIGSILNRKIKTTNEDIINFSSVFNDPERFVELAMNLKHEDPLIREHSEQELNKLWTLCQKDADAAIKRLSSIHKTGNGRFPMQKSFGLDGFEVIIDNVTVNPGQIIMGKVNAEKLGISLYSNISDIKSQGPNYFKNELQSNLSLPSKIAKTKYDAVAYLNDGSKALIVIGDSFTAAEKLGETVLDTTFRETNGTIYKNNEDEICEASDIECRKYTDSDGVDHSVFVIKSLDVLDRLNESKMIHTIRYNYNMSNIEQLLLYEHDVIINEDGTLSEPIDLTYPTFDPVLRKPTGEYETITIDKIASIEDLLGKLRQNENARINKKIETLANRRFDGFIKSLRFIGTRIPAQSMQSFMPLEVASFTNSELNDVYVPHTLTWVAGSDYKLCCSR